MRHARGFVLVLAVFLIVTLAAVGVYLVTVSTGQSQAISQDVAGARAYQAARAGIEWGTYRRLIANSCVNTPGTAVPLPGLPGYCAVVVCTQAGTTETEGSASISVYRVTATGCNVSPCITTACSPGTPAPTYVERRLEITITQ